MKNALTLAFESQRRPSVFEKIENIGTCSLRHIYDKHISFSNTKACYLAFFYDINDDGTGNYQTDCGTGVNSDIDYTDFHMFDGYTNEFCVKPGDFITICVNSNKELYLLKNGDPNVRIGQNIEKEENEFDHGIVKLKDFDKYYWFVGFASRQCVMIKETDDHLAGFEFEICAPSK